MLKKLITMFGVLVCAGAQAAPTRVSIHDFKDKSGDSQCRYSDDWWYKHLGSAFKEMLMSELTKNPNIEVLERQGIQEIYEGEHELVNSEKARKPKKGQFKVAQLVINGAVSDFEFCGSNTQGGIDVGRLAGFGSLRIGGGQGKAKVGVDLRVVDVETGAVVQTVHGEGEAKATTMKVSSDIVGEDASIGHQKNAPISQAARSAIADAVAKLSFKKKGSTSTPGVGGGA